MSRSSASIYANKLAIAQRQLRAAIRMFFSSEDELAVYAVAYNAYGVLRDLKRGRDGKPRPKPNEKSEVYGKEEAHDLYLMAFVQLIREYRQGTLPSDVARNDELVGQLRCASERLPAGAVKPDDVRVTLSGLNFKSFWTRRSDIGNFLKHADSDPDGLIDLENIDNLELLSQTLRLYLALVPNDLGAEGFVFSVYLSAQPGRTVAWEDARMRQQVQNVSELSPSKRLLFCSELIKAYRQEGLFGSPVATAK